MERSTLSNKTNAVRKNVIPFSVTYSPSLPNIREIIVSSNHRYKYNLPQPKTFEGQAK